MSMATAICVFCVLSLLVCSSFSFHLARTLNRYAHCTTPRLSRTRDCCRLFSGSDTPSSAAVPSKDSAKESKAAARYDVYKNAIWKQRRTTAIQIEKRAALGLGGPGDNVIEIDNMDRLEGLHFLHEDDNSVDDASDDSQVSLKFRGLYLCNILISVSVEWCI